MVKFNVKRPSLEGNKKMCLLALELAEMVCAGNTTVKLDDTGYTIVAIPNELIEYVKENTKNPGTIEERVKFLKELDWSRNWAEGMCKLTHPDWDRLPESEKEKCIEHMLYILAERAF